MFTKIKIPLFIAILLAIAIIIIILLWMENMTRQLEFNENVPNQTPDLMATSTNSTSTPIRKLKGDILEENFLKNVAKDPTKYPTTTISDIEYVLFSFTLYDSPDAQEGGIRLYKKMDSVFELVWESSEMIIRAGREQVRFKDINNDTIPEIVVLDGPNGTGSAMSIFVYQINNGAVHTLVPIKESNDFNGYFNGYIIGKDIFFADLENDKVPEIVVDRGPDSNVPEEERYIRTEHGFSLREDIIVYDVYTYTNGTYELTRTSVKEEEMKKLLENVDREYIL